MKDDDSWEIHKQYYLPTVEIKYYNLKIYGKTFFDQPIKDDLKTYNNIKKISADQGNDYTTECLLNYPYKKYYKLVAIDLSKQQKLDANPKEMQEINFTIILERAEGKI